MLLTKLRLENWEESKNFGMYKKIALIRIRNLIAILIYSMYVISSRLLYDASNKGGSCSVSSKSFSDKTCSG